MPGGIGHCTQVCGGWVMPPVGGGDKGGPGCPVVFVRTALGGGRSVGRGRVRPWGKGPQGSPVCVAHGEQGTSRALLRSNGNPSQLH